MTKEIVRRVVHEKGVMKKYTCIANRDEIPKILKFIEET